MTKGKRRSATHRKNEAVKRQVAERRPEELGLLSPTQLYIYRHNYICTYSFIYLCACFNAKLRRKGKPTTLAVPQ